ncbi:transcription initiation factor TFIID subunit 4-like isoform X2 [Phyllopteryx taeniolatus]|uniref:transcription initiation factor TFIID subunit 4-like isoform X2 n=1 Tax=Phyllopteryx taeniolatus TaxID=161469 RepID=UPI002AD54530|nr:transcription initiation factor TFIID subunit 4-like isoform X2 [Phyllopteryx taeniolatus]
MAGASDPLEDMLFNEVDEKAVSDLVGSLESQLGDSEAPPAAAAGKRDAAPAASASHFSGKVRDQEPPQQGHPGAAVKLQPSSVAGQLPPSSSSSSSSSSTSTTTSTTTSTSTATSCGDGGGGAASLRTLGSVLSSSPVPQPPGVQTLSGQPAASFQRVAQAQAQAGGRTPSPGLQSFNGTTGAVKLLNSAGGTPPATTSSALVVMAAPANFHQEAESAAPMPPAALQHRLPSAIVNAAHNGLEPKVGPPVPPGTPSPSQVVNHSKMPMAGQPPSGNSVILTGTTPSPAAPGIKPAVNGLGQARAAVAVQPQRAGPAAETVRPAAPQPPLAVRPQQQATIQLPPGFTMPAGMVLVRVETGHLVMVPQQVLAQAQAKTQQSPGVTAVPQRPAAPAAIRVGIAAPAPGTPQNIHLATPPQTKPLQSPSSSSSSSPSSSSSVQAITVTSGAPFSAKTPLPPKTQTAAATVAVNSAPPPASGAAPAGGRVSVVSQEMQENVKKCKNFLATLIKLVSNNSPSPDTSKNVKALVQDLLDAKIEPEEFTSRLQAELKSSPQPYLIPFLKKSLPALRQSLLSSQQSLTPPPACTPPAAAVRPRLPVGTPGVRMNAPLATATMATGRGCVQTLRGPLVVGMRTPGALMRGPAAPVAKSVVTLAPPANQKKLGDPGGGTFRDDDDINDVASMAGVNLSEENARILATSSGLVGTKIRSCKDEAFLPAGLLHRRLMDTGRRASRADERRSLSASLLRATGASGEAAEGRAREGDPAQGRQESSQTRRS